MSSILAHCTNLEKIRIDAGHVLLQEGETSGKLYFLVDGQVEILKGKHQIDIVSDPGAIFGEISVLLDIPHMATVRALSPCELYSVDSASDFLLNHQRVTYELSRMLAQRLHGVTNYLVDLKRQFEDQDNHLGMVDEVLESLSNQQLEDYSPGSDRDPEVRDPDVSP